MCGIVGFWGGHHNEVAGLALLRRMSGALVHRGPDDEGGWYDPRISLGLGHRRLSILDLSAAGHQPMGSPSGRYTIVFNGEIYNHQLLRNKLATEREQVEWKGHSDTETLLACFEAWGIERTLKESVGMFALALWDKAQQRLTLARDRVGEKPLYYGWQGDVFLFGSELKALKAHPAFNASINRHALALLLRHNCIPAPYSIYSNINKLLPGRYVSIPVGSPQTALPNELPYWSFNTVVESGLASPFIGSEQEVIDALEGAIAASVGRQMLADVPVGAFLSGGIDSSVITSLMQAQSSTPVRTFTIGTDSDTYNEAVHAKAVAHHLGTEHTELYVSPHDALSIVPLLPNMYCEPFSDSSQIPAFLVSQLARQHVTVALSGDGGDELFGGYNRYLGACRAWLRAQGLPGLVRKQLSFLLSSLAPATWDKLFALAMPVLPARFHIATPGEKAHKLAEVLSIGSEYEFFRALTSHWKDPAGIVMGAREPQTLLTNTTRWPSTDRFEHLMMALDTQTYLPDDILVKVDRAAMQNSLETRVPLLDPAVIELAWRLPFNLKIRDGKGKWLLRQVLYRHVPQSLVERPKMGFGIPLGEWLRGPLRDWAEAHLSVARLRGEGYFDHEAIRELWSQHLTGRYNWQYHLWDVLMFQAWLENQ